MKKIGKTLAAVGLTLALALGLTACDNIAAVMGGGKFDAKLYVQGQMDEMYLNKYDPEYLKLVDSTEREGEENYNSGMEVEVQGFNYYFGVEYPTDEYTERMVELYKQLYSKADYTVVSAAEQDDGSFSVKITVRPLDMIQLINDRFEDFHRELMTKYEDVDIEAMTGEEYDAWNETVFDLDYQNGLADLFESLIPEVGYMEEKAIAVQIDLDDNDYYSLSDEDFKKMDNLIIDYTDNT